VLLDGDFDVVLGDRLCAFHAVATRLAITTSLRTRVERQDVNRPFAPVDPLLAHMRDLTGPHPQPAGREDDEPRLTRVRGVESAGSLQE
jgi:hypothetical protein